MNITGLCENTAAREMLQCPTVYYTGHCTGTRQYGFLKELMDEQLHSISTGETVTI